MNFRKTLDFFAYTDNSDIVTNGNFLQWREITWIREQSKLKLLRY